MKYLRLLLLVTVIVVFAGSGFAQRTYEGRIVEVIDCKTVAIETPTGRVTAELGYIEVPERDSPLNKTVLDHLTALALGKKVEFQMQGFSSTKLTGSIFLDGVDIAQQMVRDGAAWLPPVYESSQSKPDRDVYESTQQLAKNERRGIWANESLKPARLLRIEQQEKAARQEQFAREHPGANNVVDQAAVTEANRREASQRRGKWGDVNPNMPNIGAVFNGYNAETKTGFLTTGFAEVRDLSNEDPSHRVLIDVTYVYKENERKGRTGTFVITVDSTSKNWSFLSSNDLILTVDGRNTVVGKARRKTAKDGDFVRERLTYEVSRNTIEKIYTGGNVTIRVGNYQIWFGEGSQLLLYNMLQAAP